MKANKYQVKQTALGNVRKYVFKNLAKRDSCFIYFIMCQISKKHNNANKIKIGIAKNPDRRIKELQTGNPFHLEILYSFPVPKENAEQIEGRLHRAFKWSKIRGEWFTNHPIVVKWITEHRLLSMQPEKTTRTILRKASALGVILDELAGK